MNFTRDPIIETVITPREGYKLLVRSTKNTTQEDYLVDALEVVSFGHSNFYRSQERPSAFLVPVGDFEVLETREQRIQLKNSSSEQSIKIGGGRDAAPRSRENDERDNATFSDSRPAPDRQQQGEQRSGRNRRRRRRGRDRDRGHDQQPQQQQEASHHEPREHREEQESQDATAEPAEAKAPSFISKLFPPPQTLIKETLSRYKPAEGDAPKGDLPEMDDDEE